MSLSVLTPTESTRAEGVYCDSTEEIVWKHPLENIWTWWYLKNEKSKVWTDNLSEVYSFSTAEDFWSVFNHLKAPSELKLGNDYYLFKKGIVPMWEDPANRSGGKWLLCLEKKNSVVSKLDEYWLELLLLMIGENFEEHNEEVCGLTVNVRQRMDKISLWTANACESKRDSIMAIGQIIKTQLQIPSTIRLLYQPHYYETITKYQNQNRNIYRI